MALTILWQIHSHAPQLVIGLENLTFEVIADEQQKDATLDKVKVDTSLQLKKHSVPFGTQKILCNVRTGYYNTLDAELPLS